MMLVLVSGGGGLDDLNPDSLGRLARLGVTDVSVVSDETTVGIVIHGWAFDPRRSADEATALVSGAHQGRALLPVLHATVTPDDR